METPPSVPEEFEPDAPRRANVIDAALDEGRDWLTEIEAKRVLAAYDVPVAETVSPPPRRPPPRSPPISAAGGLKILSPDITHKTDVGGVALGLDGPAAVEAAAKTMLERVTAAAAGSAHRRLHGGADDPTGRAPTS